MKQQASGFSLIELMIVVAVIGTISMIAFPSYQNYLLKGKRAEGRIALLAAAQKQERYFTTNNAYTIDLTASGIPAFSGNTAGSSAYTISIVPGAAGIATSFTATATPTTGFTDPACNILTYNHAGTKGMQSATETDASRCW